MELKFRLDDQTRFPMIWVPADDGFFIHWLPVTKVQFEYFLCAAPSPRFDEAWYDNLLQLNERVSPKKIKAKNYWNAFLTGIQPQEAEQFAGWCGDDFALPTLDEWNAAYRFFKQVPGIDILERLSESQLELVPRVVDLLAGLDKAPKSEQAKMGVQQRSLADQTLMRLGVSEWVKFGEHESEFGGMGQPHPDLHSAFFTPDSGKPMRLNDPDTARVKFMGFRLVTR